MGEGRMMKKVRNKKKVFVGYGSIPRWAEWPSTITPRTKILRCELLKKPLYSNTKLRVTVEEL